MVAEHINLQHHVYFLCFIPTFFLFFRESYVTISFRKLKLNPCKKKKKAFKVLRITENLEIIHKLRSGLAPEELDRMS